MILTLDDQVMSLILIIPLKMSTFTCMQEPIWLVWFWSDHQLAYTFKVKVKFDLAKNKQLVNRSACYCDQLLDLLG